MKRGSANSFFSAARLRDGSTSGPMYAVKSASNVSDSTGGSATGSADELTSGAAAAGAVVTGEGRAVTGRGGLRGRGFVHRRAAWNPTTA